MERPHLWRRVRAERCDGHMEWDEECVVSLHEAAGEVQGMQRAANKNDSRSEEGSESPLNIERGSEELCGPPGFSSIDDISLSAFNQVL